jgi:phage nucleotide-binding protein
MTILDEPITLTHLGGLEVKKVLELPFTFNMLIYGDWGVGKTMLAGQSDDVPEMRKVLFIDLEAGTASLRDYPNIDVVRVTSWPQMQEVYDHLRTGQHPYQTIVLDSLTEIQKFNQDEVMRLLILKDASRDPDILGLQEWNKSSNQIRKFVRAFRDLPYNVIFTSLEQVARDKMQRQIKLPALPGKLAKEIPGFFDYVFYYYIDTIDEQEVRILRTQRSSDTAAKAREGHRKVLPALVGNPTMKQLYGMIKNEQDEAVKTEQETMSNE